MKWNKPCVYKFFFWRYCGLICTLNTSVVRLCICLSVKLGNYHIDAVFIISVANWWDTRWIISCRLVYVDVGNWWVLGSKHCLLWQNRSLLIGRSTSAVFKDLKNLLSWRHKIGIMVTILKNYLPIWDFYEAISEISAKFCFRNFDLQRKLRK